MQVSTPRGRGAAAFTLALLGCVACGACGAEAPAFLDGTTPPVGQGPYAQLVSCSPRSPCPGPTCAENAAGKPDGTSVDMRGCATLDLSWNGGSSSTSSSQADLAVYLQRNEGTTRVEASPDARDAGYVLVGFIGPPQGNAPTSCQAVIQGNKALLEFDSCNLVNNVTHVRLTRVAAGTLALAVDAVELLTYNPLVKP